MTSFLSNIGMRAVPALISFVMLLLFIAPLFTGIVNLGNISGIFMSAAFFFFSVYYDRIIPKISHIRTFKCGRIAVDVIIICITLALAYFAFVTVCIFQASHDKPESEKTTLIVLGCKVKNDRPSLMLKKRLDTAYDYLSDHPEICAIVSGGKGNDEKISEAECMYNYLIERGISPERLFMENNSVSTFENLRFSKEIIAEKGLPSDITLVTDGYHQLRAEMIAENLGFNSPKNLSAPTSLWLVPTYYVREWFGVAYQFIGGRT